MKVSAESVQYIISNIMHSNNFYLNLYLRSLSQERNQSTVEDEIIFVDSPSEEFFCPVNSSLLLKPHLTLCCGKHLSEECATEIQKDGGPCPLCKAPTGALF